MTTKQAWINLIFQKGIEKKLDISSNTLYYFRSQSKNEIFPAIETMETYLKAAGFKVVQEKMWEEKK